IFGHSCRSEHFIITDIEFYSLATQDEYPGYVQTENFTTGIIFGIKYIKEFVSAANFDISTRAYATTLPQKIDNPVIEESITLSFDRPFYHNGQLVPANQNIFENSDIFNQIILEKRDYAPYPILITFTDEFISSSEFSAGIFAALLTCETTDNRFFEKSIEVQFNLQ